MINNKLVYGITLARGGSKSIPNKNLAQINNRSLLERAITTSLNSKYIDDYFVSSDSDEILDIATKLGATAVKRPPVLASDTASSAEAILNWINTLYDKPYYIVESMCTSPFKTTIDIDNCIEKLDLTQADSVVAVHRIYDHHPARLKYIMDDMLVNFYPEIKETRRQDLIPAAYVRSGSIYAFTYNSIFRYKSRYGGVCRPYILADETKSINIDEPNDLLLAQWIGEKNDL